VVHPSAAPIFFDSLNTRSAPTLRAALQDRHSAPRDRFDGGPPLQREARGRTVDVGNEIVGLLVEGLRQRIVAAVFRGEGCERRALVGLDDRLGGIFRVTAELP
jgi:hypothetical protein